MSYSISGVHFAGKKPKMKTTFGTNDQTSYVVQLYWKAGAIQMLSDCCKTALHSLNITKMTWSKKGTRSHNNKSQWGF